MTDIIGHDIDGRPLRAGDEAVIAEAIMKQNVGQCVRVLCNLGRVEGFAGDERIGIDKVLTGTFGSKVNHARPETHRKLHNDHRPANESFTEMMDRLKGVRV